MGYDDNEGSSGEALAGLGLLAVIAAPFVGGYAIYRLVQANKKSDCFSCKRTYRNKELVVLKICWDLPIIEKTNCRDVDEFEDLSFDLDDFDLDTGTWKTEKKRESYKTYEEDNSCCSIRLKSNWPTEYIVPDEFRHECEDYFKKKVCKDCAQKIYNELVKRAQFLAEKAEKEKRLAAKKAKEEKRLAAEQAKIELEKSKICCPRCNAKFLPIELSRPDSSKLPWYWVKECYNNTDICKKCRNEILTCEHGRYLKAKGKSSAVITYPASYKGNIEIDYPSAKNDIESGTYIDRDDALNELKLRAFLGGFNVVFNYTWNRGIEVEDADSSYVESSNYIRGTHKYSVWRATGSFAKTRI